MADREIILSSKDGWKAEFKDTLETLFTPQDIRLAVRTLRLFYRRHMNGRRKELAALRVEEEKKAESKIVIVPNVSTPNNAPKE